ncbi:MAG: PAS domain-containing sensor histidine kinase [Burkholderiales bacterium]|nr:PAS domain-containing sensor histidine kinase [Burkholderiales bacterium]
MPVSISSSKLLDSSDAVLWRDKLTLLLESTGEGVYGIDLEGRCTFINRAGAAMLGYKPSDVLGRNMHALAHHAHEDGRHYAEEECPIFLAFRKGQPCRVDQEVFWRADGRCFPVEYSSHQIISHGEVRGAVVTFSDISIRRQAEEQLRRAKQDLEQRVEERTCELSAALTQLRELSAHAHSVREEERKRIAREIHDELGSLLVALKLDVDWLGKRVADREPLAHKCEAMTGLIEAAVENVGRIITDLRPSMLDHQGLIAALEWQVQEFAESTELQCDSVIEVAPGAKVPQGNLATAAFRIFQEMLSNVARHAHAHAVRIRINVDAGRLNMEVADDGIGASPAAFDHARSYGVMGMRERALHFGGALVIHSVPHEGTRACLSIPLEHDEGAAS